MGILFYILVLFVGGTLGFLLLCTLAAEATEELSEKGSGPHETEVVSQYSELRRRTDE
jgi:hypothetical protein